MASLFADSNINFLAVNSFDNYKTTAKSGGCAIYDFFIRQGIMERDEVKVRGCMIQAMQDLKNNDTTSATVINRAKALYVDSFYNELRAAGMHIREFIQGKITEMNKV